MIQHRPTLLNPTLLYDVARFWTRWPNECNMLDATLGLESSGSNIGLPKKSGARSIDCEEVFGRSSSQALLEMLEEEDDRITKRVKTKTLDKKKGRKRYFNNIAAAKRLTVNFMIPRAATGEPYRSLKVSSFVFRER